MVPTVTKFPEVLRHRLRISRRCPINSGSRLPGLLIMRCVYDTFNASAFTAFSYLYAMTRRRMGKVIYKEMYVLQMIEHKLRLNKI